MKRPGIDEVRPARAVALRYTADEMAAPQVVAKGRGELAERILAISAEADIPVVEDGDLVELLEAVELLDEIPTELFTAVAETLAFLYRLKA